MAFPQVSDCCCAFSLERGSKIIGFLHTLCALSLVIYTALLATEARRLIGTVDDADGTYSSVHRYTCVVAAAGSVHVLLGVVLLVGAFRHKTQLLLAWVVMMTFLYLAAILFSIVITALYAPHKPTSEIVMGFCGRRLSNPVREKLLPPTEE